MLGARKDYNDTLTRGLQTFIFVFSLRVAMFRLVLQSYICNQYVAGANSLSLA